MVNKKYMSYSLARKVFVCDTCVPQRQIKMLVGKDQMTVICDSCRGTAKVKPIEEEAKSPTLSSNIGASTTDSR